MSDKIPDYIIDAVLEFAIIGYAKENSLEMMRGKLWPEKPDWLPHLNALVSADERKELARLAGITADSNETAMINIRRVFDSCSIEEIKERYNHVARKPDSTRADAGKAIGSAIAEIKRGRQPKA